MVPEGWQIKRLGQVATLQRGFDLPRQARVEGPYPIVSSSGISGYHDSFQVEPPGVVTGRSGTIGEVFFLEQPFWPLNTSLWVKDFHDNDPRFIYYLLSSVGLERFRYQTGVPGVNRNDIHEHRVLLPPVKEQRAIAALLDTWEAAKEQTETIISALHERKRGLMQVLLTGKKRFKAFQSTGQFERLSIKDIADVDSRQLSSNTAPDFAFDYVSLSDVSQGRILGALPRMRFAEAPSRARKLVQKGDVLLSTVRPNLKGFAMVGDEADSLVVSTGFAVLSVRAGFDPGYLYHYLFSDDITKQIESLVTGSNYPAISTRDVRRLQVNVPTLSEQRMISSVLTTADVEIETLEKQREAYKLQKRGLMQQLLTGKKRAKIEDPEPFSA